MSDPLPKRFYTSAHATQAKNGWRVELDGRELKTPAKSTLILPTAKLASAVAEEWNGQGETIDVTSMPLTRLANVALDRTPETRDAMASEVAKYAETDLVSHLAEGPEGLRARQDEKWRPWRDWAGRELSVLLIPVEGVIAPLQPQASLDAARNHAAGLDDFALTGLVWGCGLFGSAILALAVERRALAGGDAFTLSRLDEDWQIEHWGEDEEAALAAAARAREADTLETWFAALNAA